MQSKVVNLAPNPPPNLEDQLPVFTSPSFRVANLYYLLQRLYFQNCLLTVPNFTASGSIPAFLKYPIYTSFSYLLFNDAVSSSDNVPSNNRVINK